MPNQFDVVKFLASFDPENPDVISLLEALPIVISTEDFKKLKDALRKTSTHWLLEVNAIIIQRGNSQMEIIDIGSPSDVNKAWFALNKDDPEKAKTSQIRTIRRNPARDKYLSPR